MLRSNFVTTRASCACARRATWRSHAPIAGSIRSDSSRIWRLPRPVSRCRTRGSWQGQSFVLTGRVEYAHPAGGSWEEWYLKLADGRWAWLSHAHGSWAITFQGAPAPGLPGYEQITPGMRLTLGAAPGVSLTVGERNAGILRAAEGELPFVPSLAALSRFVDSERRQGSLRDARLWPAGKRGAACALPRAACDPRAARAQTGRRRTSRGGRSGALGRAPRLPQLRRRHRAPGSRPLALGDLQLLRLAARLRGAARDPATPQRGGECLLGHSPGLGRQLRRRALHGHRAPAAPRRVPGRLRRMGRVPAVRGQGRLPLARVRARPL